MSVLKKSVSPDTHGKFPLKKMTVQFDLQPGRTRNICRHIRLIIRKLVGVNGCQPFLLKDRPNIPQLLLQHVNILIGRRAVIRLGIKTAADYPLHHKNMKPRGVKLFAKLQKRRRAYGLRRHRADRLLFTD